MTLYSEILRQSGTADIQTHYQYPASQKSKGQSQVDADETLLWGIERNGFFNGRGKWVKGFENQRV